MRRGFVVLAVCALTAMVTLPGPAAAELQVEVIKETCGVQLNPDKAQYCDTRAYFSVVTTGHLLVQFTAAYNLCSSFRVHIEVSAHPQGWDPYYYYSLF